MRRKTSCKVVKKHLKQETKTELTDNSEEQQISLEINKNIFDSNENPFQSEDANLSSQSSEYEERKPKRGQGKGKRSMKKQKKQTLKRKQSANKKQKSQKSSRFKIPANEDSQIISKRYSDLFFSEQSSKDETQGKNVKKPKAKKTNKSKLANENIKEKQMKKDIQVKKPDENVDFWKKLKIPQKKQQKKTVEKKDLKSFILQHGDLHITDYELVNQEKILEQVSQQNSSKIRYIFEPKYKVSERKQNDQSSKIALTSDQIAQNHDLFIELIRFYRNMWEDHSIISKMFI